MELHTDPKSCSIALYHKALFERRALQAFCIVVLSALTCACATTMTREANTESIESKLSRVKGLSWYNCNKTPKDCSQTRLTSSGAAYDSRRMTAASGILPNGTEILIKAFGKKLKVCVNDRSSSADRIDLTSGAFKVLAPLQKGIITSAQFQIFGLGMTDRKCQAY